MKLNLSCEQHKSDAKAGRCACAFLNRNFMRELKIYKAFVKNLERKGK